MDEETQEAPNEAWRDWHVPLSETRKTMREALEGTAAFTLAQDDVPLIVQLVENPRFDLPWIDVFPGAVDLRDHDCIHLLLGRGLLPTDEAFVIGFTMGSAKRASDWNAALYEKVNRWFYGEDYRFDADDARVYRDAFNLAQVSDCAPLAEVAFDPLLDVPLGEARARVGLETELLTAYFAVERRRRPANPASERLLGG